MTETKQKDKHTLAEKLRSDGFKIGLDWEVRLHDGENCTSSMGKIREGKIIIDYRECDTAGGMRFAQYCRKNDIPFQEVNFEYEKTRIELQYRNVLNLLESMNAHENQQ